MFGGDVVGVVPTLEAVCGDNPELSVVGADGFDEVLCEAKSLPPFAPPPPPPLVPDEPPELPVTVFEHLRHLGSQEWRRTNFLYSFLTCNGEADPPPERKVFNGALRTKAGAYARHFRSLFCGHGKR